MGLFNRKKKKDESKTAEASKKRTDQGEREINPKALKEALSMLGATVSVQAEDDVKRAREEGRRGDWKEAVKYYDKVIATRSKSDKALKGSGGAAVGPTPLYMLYGERGTAHTYTRDFKAALADYCEALKLQPNNIHFMDCRGLVYYQMDEYEKALKDFTKALSLNPPSDNRKARIYANRAACYRELRKSELALKDLEAASQICTDEKLKGNLKILAEQVLAAEGKKSTKICSKCGKEVHALTYKCPACGNTLFQISSGSDYNYIERQQNLAASHVDRGSKFFFEKRYDEAEKEFKKALEMNPVNATAHGNLGVLYLRTDRPKEAVKYFEKTKKLNPNMTGLSALMKEAKEKAGQ